VESVRGSRGARQEGRAEVKAEALKEKDLDRSFPDNLAWLQGIPATPPPTRTRPILPS